jgi:hypothetical protein
MKQKISFTLLALFLTGTVLAMSKVLKKEPYTVPEITNQVYEEAVNSKKPLFLSFNATWCPSCQKQNASLGTLIPRFKDSALIYTVNWDERDNFKGPKTKQRTTIAYILDGNIKDELIGETDANKIEKFIIKNIGQ